MSNQFPLFPLGRQGTERREPPSAGFPVPTGPLVRKGGPWTSREAARELKAGDRLAAKQRLAYNYVRLHPGSTANELARLADYRDPRTINRRLSELKAAGLIYCEGWTVDEITGKKGVRWWPR